MKQFSRKRLAVLRLESLDDRITPAAGGLDPSFGIGGKVTTPIGAGDDNGEKVAIDSEGRIVVGGFSYNGSNADFSLTRLNADGTLDSSFGDSGKVITPIGSGDDFGLNVAIDASDRIVLAGYSFNGATWDFAVARYKPDGSLDTSFDGDGIATTDIWGANNYCQGVVIDDLGRIVLVGHTQNGTLDVTVVRYLENGALDSTFGVGGIVITDVRGTDDFCTNVAIDGTGRLVVTGSSFNGVDHDVMAVDSSDNHLTSVVAD